MSLKRRKILKQMFNLGYGTQAVPADSGGTLTGDKVGIHTFIPGMFNIRDFGAVGDGSTDDATAIALALSTASSVPGSEVFVPQGTYLVSTYLTIPTGVTIRGTGRLSQILAASANLSATPDSSGAASAVLYVHTGSTNVVIRDLYVKGAYSGTGTSGITFGIRIAGTTTNCQVLNSYCTHHSWSGIYAEGSKHLIQGNYTEHNAIDGIEFYAKRTQVIGNRSYDDGAAALNGVGSIEVLPGADHAVVMGNISDTSNNQGITVSSNGTAANGVLIQGNHIYSSGGRGIVDNAGSTNLRVIANYIDTPRGSATLGNGIMLSNSTRFTVANNTIVGANTGSGPNGIEIAGTANHGVVSGNVLHNNWVGVVLSGTSGATGTILVCNNHAYGSTSGTDYTVTSSGAYVKASMNSWGTTAFSATIPGTVTSDSAATGDIGEYVSSQIAVGSAVSMTTNTTHNVTSISLTAGDWDVSACANFKFAPTTSYTILQYGISTTSAAIPARDNLGIFETPAAVPSGNTDPAFPTPIVRVSLAATTTVYFVVRSTFTVDTLSVYGTIRARRMR